MTLHKVFSAIAILSIPLLSACAGASNTEKDFLCPAQTGNGSPCSTIGEADGRNQASKTPVAERFSDTLGKEMSRNPLTYASGKGGGSATGAPLTGMTDGGMAYTAAQYRVPEQVGTLWIAPHLDGEGLLHEATFVHFVVREAQWTSGRS
ncbi:TraV family lipoprotein [Cereibacter sp. SYSU M97828]|nr:TraV family lipoprotein [Cereibacter flavus]